MKRHNVVVLEVNLDKGFPIKVVFRDLCFVENKTAEVEIFCPFNFGQIINNRIGALEQQPVPSCQGFFWQMQAGLRVKMRRAQQSALVVIGPPMQRANNISSLKLPRTFEHDRLAVPTNIRDQLNGGTIVDQCPGIIANGSIIILGGDH